MSRTYKDSEFKYPRNTYIKHDHSTGHCIIKPAKEPRKSRYHAGCPRIVKDFMCVHNGDRAHELKELSQLHELARKTYLSSFIIFLEMLHSKSSEEYKRARDSQTHKENFLNKAQALMRKGYFPHCTATGEGVHSIEVPSRWQVEDSLMGEALGSMRYYDNSIPCEYCDSLPTCEVRSVIPRKYWYEDDDEPPAERLNGKLVRDALRDLVHEYNTYGDLENE